MIGRAIYHSPYFLAEIEKEIFNNSDVPTRAEVMENLIPYIQEQTSKGVQLNHIMRHTVGLFHGQKRIKRMETISFQKHVHKRCRFAESKSYNGSGKKN